MSHVSRRDGLGRLIAATSDIEKPRLTSTCWMGDGEADRIAAKMTARIPKSFSAHTPEKPRVTLRKFSWQ